ncbi:hypothetical protein AG1IA_08638 [Rhizoctonia solani AG-1 IA]|uniref:Uncharacterized protein n=1 Tax=Thanatephorus cucumeris (strain AG1-IA) TaxID=983506 RepID=L8WLX3_THACA|nr:hypothetical protein AG1IA_08638 [Rhizoctonia solani AG-1 IA]
MHEFILPHAVMITSNLQSALDCDAFRTCRSVCRPCDTFVIQEVRYGQAGYSYETSDAGRATNIVTHHSKMHLHLAMRTRHFNAYNDPHKDSTSQHLKTNKTYHYGIISHYPITPLPQSSRNMTLSPIARAHQHSSPTTTHILLNVKHNSIRSKRHRGATTYI